MQEIVEEAVLLIPHLVVVIPNTIHGVGDPQEMLQEAEGNLFIHGGVVLGEDERNLQHVLAVKGHPCRAVRLIEMTTGGQRRTAIKNAYVVESKKSAREHIASLWVLPVYPPIEIQHQSLERSFQEAEVGSSQLFLNAVEEQCCPGVNGRVYVAEVPFISRNLPVGVGIEVPQHQQELLFGEVEIDKGKRNGMKRQVPCRVPGIFPLVGHGDDFAVEHVEPLGVA